MRASLSERRRPSLASCVLHLWLSFVFAGWLAAGAAAAQAAQPPLHRQVWTERDGAPSLVLALAQTPDGWLWVGTPTGLFRFDGMRFDRVDRLGGTPLPQTGIRHLSVTRDGTLWIGYIFGGVSRYAGARLVNHGVDSGLPRSSVNRVLMDRDAGVWAATSTGLYRLADGRWQRFGEAHSWRAMLQDRNGRFWLRDARGSVFAFRAGDRQPQRIGPEGSAPDPFCELLDAGDGTVWSVDAETGAHAFDDQGGERPLKARLPANIGAPLLVDPAGSLWYASHGEVKRVDRAAWSGPAPQGDAAGADPKPAAQTDAPQAEEITALLRDREGNVWAGTLHGLVRLRVPRLHRLDAAGAVSMAAIASDPQGRLWIASMGRPLLKVVGDAVVERSEAPLEDPVFLHVDREGTGWFGDGQRQLWRIQGAQLERLEVPRDAQPRWIAAAARDRQGRLWISGRGGLYRQEGGQWQPLARRGAVPDDTATVLYTDADGSVWAGYPGSTLLRFDGDRATRYGQDQGLAVGNLLTLHQGAKRLWVGGETGVALFKDGRFVPLLLAGELNLHGVSGIVETPSGELWLNGAEGVTRLPADEVARFDAAPAHRPAFERFDHRDGLEGVSQQVHNMPTAARGADGRLWFSTSTGVWWIAPDRIERNPVPPAVSLRSLRAAGRQWPDGEQPRLPEGTGSVEIEYTATSLTMPERVRFKYRMEGVDRDWQDAGTRRAAYYTNLAPGRHRFLVMAANEDGVWSTSEATLAFEIEPALHQTLWFRVAAGLLLASLLSLLYVLRVRQVTRRAAERLRVQLAERERIAGELHDTLLQGVHALLLNAQRVLDRPADREARSALEQVVEMAERLVAEGRDRISGLRRPARTEPDLPQRLRSVIDDLSIGQPVPVLLECEGDASALPREVGAEVLLILREAVVNALRHARATRIDVRFVADADRLTLRVCDDGIGLDADSPRAPEAGGGHWGLLGMHQRAQRIGAALSIGRREPSGTVVELSWPAGSGASAGSHGAASAS